MTAAVHRLPPQSTPLPQELAWPLALDRAGFGVVVWDLARGEITIGPQVERMLGLAVGSLGHSPDALLRRIHPDDLSDCDRRWDDVVAGRSAAFVSEHRLRCADGSYRWVVARGAAAAFDPEGRPTHVVVTCVDIGPLEQIAAALELSRQRFRGAFEHSAVGMALIGLDGRFLEVNGALAAMIQRPRDELLQVGVQDITAGQDPSEDALLLRRFAEGDVTAYQTERRYVAPSGADVWIHLSCALVRRADGSPDHLVAHVQDVTARKRAELELRASLAQKEALVQEVHHRVKNNLQIVTSLLRLQAEPLVDPEAHRAITESLARIDAIAALHEKLYRSEDLERIDARDYLEDLVGTIMRAHGNRVHAEVDVPPIALSIAIGVPLGLLVNELVTNAIKHGFPSPSPTSRIGVALQRIGGRARLVVHDNGRGVPLDLDLARPDTVGLRLARCMARQLRGSLSVERGDGTAFVVEFDLPVGGAER